MTPPILPYSSPAPPVPQLAPEHFAQLQQASRAMRKVRRAFFTAQVDGWSVGSFGLLTAALGYSDLPTLGLGLAMIAVAFVELRAAPRLRRLDLTAARTLGWNQIALGSALILYAIIRLISVMRNPNQFSDLTGQDAQMREMLGDVADLTRQILMLVYACVILVAIFAQGGLALYYFTRASIVRRYVEQTPQWVLDLQRSGVSV